MLFLSRLSVRSAGAEALSSLIVSLTKEFTKEITHPSTKEFINAPTLPIEARLLAAVTRNIDVALERGGSPRLWL